MWKQFNAGPAKAKFSWGSKKKETIAMMEMDDKEKSFFLPLTAYLLESRSPIEQMVGC